MPPTISTWDASEYLETQRDIVEYLNAALADPNPAILQTALGDVANARGMSTIAKRAGISRESLDKSLSPEGTPSWRTIMKILRALGLEIRVKAHV